MKADVVIIGAGPAGMAAASTVAQKGLAVLLLDDQIAPGGQIYRGVERASESDQTHLGSEYFHGKSLVEEVRATGVEYLSGASVWQLSEEGEVAYSVGGRSTLVKPKKVILATGAMERPFPIAGWTLPGLMTGGAAQILLKTSGLAAEGAVFAGCGPLLYLVVHQYLQAGVKITALLDTASGANRLPALKHLPAALSRFDLLAKGLKWKQAIRKSGTRIVDGVTELRVEGGDVAEGISFRQGSGGWQTLTTSHIFLHQGVVPNVNLSMSAGVAHSWCEQQLCWRPEVDDFGASDKPAIYVAGDGSGISGALAAEASGRLAALGVLADLGAITPRARDEAAQPFRRVRHREEQIRPFLDSWFKPSADLRQPSDQATLVCRCEEVRAEDLKSVIGLGLKGPNQVKSYCRAGMGPCQGRFCGLTVQEMIATQSGLPHEQVGYYRLRPPIKPLPLNELADLTIEE